MDMDSEYDDAKEDVDYFRSEASSRQGSMGSSAASGVPGRATPTPGGVGWGVSSLLDSAWRTASATTHAVLNPISTTKELANTMASSAQNALARTLGVDPEIIGNVMTRPLELLLAASNETREVTSLWIQFIVSIIDVLRTQEAAETVSHIQDTGNAFLQIVRSEEFAAVKDSFAAFIASDESTAVVREVAQQSQRWLAVLRTEEVRESTRRLLAFVSKVVNLADTTGIRRPTPDIPVRRPGENSPGRGQADSSGLGGGEGSLWGELLTKIEDLNETAELLTDHEAMRLRKLCRARLPSLMVVYSAFKTSKNERRLLRGLREVLEDTAPSGDR
ncbi:hypothetical protein DFJ74DRAFT_513242 [Hyaloraphidium curvatum]|nr:hypothetical protein DFJ74DRAFT_513242 [Hyaloraphidium curvatum]